MTVEAVGAGAEEDLRHLLDGAVQQANADFAPEDAGRRRREPSEEDSAMTERVPVLRGRARRPEGFIVGSARLRRMIHLGFPNSIREL